MTSFEPIAPSPPTHHASVSQRSLQHRPFSDPNRLAPEDAFLPHSPPRTRREQRPTEVVHGVSHGATQFSTSDDGLVRRKRDKDRGRSGSRRRKGEWKRLLWVRHPGCTTANSHDQGKRLSKLMLYRSGQLHRPTDISLPSAAQSASAALRFLAAGRRLYGHCSAHLLGCNICLLLRRHQPGAHISGLRGWLG